MALVFQRVHTSTLRFSISLVECHEEKLRAMRGDYAAEVDKVLALKERMGDAPYSFQKSHPVPVLITTNVTQRRVAP